MPTAPGGARWVGVALWKGAPTVPWGAGWEAEKRAKRGRETVAECVELTSSLPIAYLRTTSILKSLAAAAALYPAPRPLARRPLSAHSGE